MKRLEGKIAIITGAARGQGANEARRFVAEGAKVALTDLDPAGAAVAQALGDDALFIRHDVAKEQGWTEVVTAAMQRFGRIDILVNNAGIFVPGVIADVTPEIFERHFQVNQLGVFLGMKSVIGPMAAGGGGSIVNISSAAGQRGYPDIIAYASTKWAVRGMTKCAARELAPQRIRVNSVHPGLVDTPMIGNHTAETLRSLSESVPLGRIGTTDDVAEIVIFLASDLSDYLTGSEITVDGGTGL